MSNSFFKFKQFTIHQDKCAMKVCTDACLFSAIVAQSSWPKAQSCLDIGTGTGLLALMLAQKNTDAIFDAVEIDINAAIQAASNFEASPWKERLKVFHTSIQRFNPAKKYDLIISNPPFFENDLKSPDDKRNLALHSDALSLEELIASVQKNISATGIFAVLLPFHRSAFFEMLAMENNFHLTKKISVRQTPVHNYFRSILFFSMQPASIEEKEMTIQNGQSQYTAEFMALLKDYYLYL